MIRFQQCRNCGAKSGGGFCSQICFDQHREARHEKNVKQKLRHDALTRDKGFCASCSLDTIRLLRNIKRLIEIARPKHDGVQYEADPRAFEAREELEQIAARYPWALQKVYYGWQHPSTLWNADHIQARINGGTNTIKNIQTLCLDCHTKKGFSQDRPLRKAQLQEEA